ncbi:importin-alpha export receptor [Dinochytrium kinnereticum]|nr:importin-alpha export receptor [Dinochytrium kinnereticum]
MQIVEVLQATLSPHAEARKNGRIMANILSVMTHDIAEVALVAMEKTAGFSLSLLNLCQSDAIDLTVRFAGIVYFKNLVKKCWKEVFGGLLMPDLQLKEGQASSIGGGERESIKAAVVGGLGALRGNLQLQLSESIALIAEDEFPDRWPNLIPELVSKLTMEDFTMNLGVLQALHSIFKRWRHQERTDTLFLAIKKVLEEFSEPFLLFFKTTDNLIDTNAQDKKALEILFQNLLLLVKIFFSLNCQDLPEFFENHQEEFMSFFQKYLLYSNPLFGSSSDDDEATIVEKVKSAICEVIALYASKYEEDFPRLPDFVTIIWNLLTTLGPQTRNDTLICKAMDFLTVVVKPARHKAMFENPEIIQSICEKIVLPNITLRDIDEEQFEDGGFEVIRHDLEGSEFETRRKSATDLIRGLLEHFNNEITVIMMNYLKLYFENYEKDPIENWKSKDTALYLAGVTKLNELVNPMPIFLMHVLPDLKTPFTGKVKDIIRVDALKFTTTFRAQLTKEQTLDILPFVAQHLTSANSIVATYAAVCIERILLVKADSSFSITNVDLKPFAQNMFTGLFALMYKGGPTPEKVAENDYALKAVTRLIATMGADILEYVGELLNRFNAILQVISANPSNPKFNHFLFESLGLLIRNVSAVDPRLLEQFEAVLFPPFQAILQQDISEYTPYVFQLFSQMLSLHKEEGIPTAYAPMFQPILLPVLWESHGNIPALVALLEIFLEKGKSGNIGHSEIPQILGVYQKLIASRMNDQYGFDLLETIYDMIPMETLANFHKNIFLLILQRLMSSRTPKFTRSFVRFLCNLFLSDKQNVTADMVIGIFDSLEPGLFAKVLRSIIIPFLGEQGHSPTDRKLICVAFARLLTTSSKMLEAPNLSLWPELLNIISDLLQIADAERDENLNNDRTVLDLEGQGYQSNFVKLSSATKMRKDRTAGIANHKQFVMEEMSRLKHSPKANVLPPAVVSLLG